MRGSSCCPAQAPQGTALVSYWCHGCFPRGNTGNHRVVSRAPPAPSPALRGSRGIGAELPPHRPGHTRSGPPACCRYRGLGRPRGVRQRQQNTAGQQHPPGRPRSGLGRRRCAAPLRRHSTARPGGPGHPGTRATQPARSEGPGALLQPRARSQDGSAPLNFGANLASLRSPPPGPPGTCQQPPPPLPGPAGSTPQREPLPAPPPPLTPEVKLRTAPAPSMADCGGVGSGAERGGTVGTGSAPRGRAIPFRSVRGGGTQTPSRRCPTAPAPSRPLSSPLPPKHGPTALYSCLLGRSAGVAACGGHGAGPGRGTAASLPAPTVWEQCGAAVPPTRPGAMRGHTRSAGSERGRGAAGLRAKRW